MQTSTVAFQQEMMTPRVLVDRQRLLRHIEAFSASDQRLLTIWGPGGIGKTTLLEQWEDLLISRGVTAQILRAGGQAAFPSAEAVRAASAQGLRWLLIDNVNTFVGGAGVAPLVNLLSSLPAGVRIIMTGRYAPDAFAEVVDAAGGELSLAHQELAFTSDETLQLAELSAVCLSVADCDTLTSHTGGWAAGIALAMPYLATLSDKSAAIREFDGDNHQVADYLVRRVLDGLDDLDREVLMRAAVTEDVPLDLAVTLTRRRDAGAVLHRMSSRHLLVDVDRRLDGFRFHPILVGYMRAEYRRRDECGAIQNHAAAARWYEQLGSHNEAMHQALQSRDHSIIAAQLERSGLLLLMQGRSAIVANALHKLEGTCPSLPVAVIRLAMDVPTFPDRIGAMDHMATINRLLADAPEDVAERWRPIIRTISALLIVDPAEASATLESLGVYLRTTPLPSLPAALGVRLAIAHCLIATNRFEDAEALLLSVQAAAQRSGAAWVFLVATDLAATLAGRRGDWRTAAVQEQRMASMHFDTTPPFNRATARAMLINTLYSYERCEPVSFKSIHQIETADPTGTELGLGFQTRSLLLLHALDGGRTAREAFAQLVDLVRTNGASHARVVAAIAPRLYEWSRILHGTVTAGEIRRLIASVLGTDSLELLTMRVREAGGDWGLEHTLAERLQTEHGAWTGTSVVHAYLALAERALHTARPVDAAEHVRRGLEVSEQYGYAREFLACQGRGARLVVATRGHHGPSEPYAADLLRLCSAAHMHFDDGDALVPLTRKERELLLELPEHQTVGDIAAKHHLSSNTVKTHLRSIYQKLAVSGRAEAVATARKHGLI